MSLLFIWRNDFDAGTIHLRGPLERAGPEIETFWSPKLQRAKRVPFGPKKDLFPAHEGDWALALRIQEIFRMKIQFRNQRLTIKKIKLAGLSNSFFSSGSSFYPFLPLGCMQSHVLNWLVVNIWWNKQKTDFIYFSFLIYLSQAQVAWS